MSVMRVGFLLALVACYSPGYSDCEITCGGGSCPSGFVCDQGVCRVEGFSGACGLVTRDSRIDSPPNADDDGDGIINADDNCPTVFNATQFNEDRDPRGDACDPCPVDAAVGADDDSDGDGVGNGCDPEPGMPNRIDVFEGFNLNTPPTLAATTGGWTFSGGQARGIPSGTEGPSITWPEPTSTTVMVSAHFTIDMINATVGTNFIGVAHSIGGQEVRCSLTTNTNGALELVSMGARISSAPVPVTVGTTAVTFSTRTGQTYVCAEAVSSIMVSGPANSPVTVGARTGFYASGTSATLDWVLVASRVP